MQENQNYENYGLCNKIGKRAIIRGFTFPHLSGNNQKKGMLLKERPCLIVSDPDAYNGNHNGVILQMVPIYSMPHSDFDIPIELQDTFMDDGYESDGRLCYIHTQELFAQSSSYVFSLVTRCSICPDYVFDLVQKVRKLFVKATMESYAEAKSLVKEYRCFFMQNHGLEKISYSYDKSTVYNLYQDGREEYVGVGNEKAGVSIEENKKENQTEENQEDIPTQLKPLKVKLKSISPLKGTNSKYVKSPIFRENTSFQDFVEEKDSYIPGEPETEVVYSSGSSSINSLSDAFKGIKTCYADSANPIAKKTSIPVKKPEAIVKNSSTDKSIPKRVFTSKLSDEELLSFMKLLKTSGRAYEVADKLCVTPTSVYNRYNKVCEELKKRGMEDKIIPWPFSREKIYDGGGVLNF